MLKRCFFGGKNRSLKSQPCLLSVFLFRILQCISCVWFFIMFLYSLLEVFTSDYPQDYPITTSQLVFNKSHWYQWPPHGRSEQGLLLALLRLQQSFFMLTRRCLSYLAKTKFSYPFKNISFMSTVISYVVKQRAVCHVLMQAWVCCSKAQLWVWTVVVFAVLVLLKPHLWVFAQFSEFLFLKNLLFPVLTFFK